MASARTLPCTVRGCQEKFASRAALEEHQIEAHPGSKIGKELKKRRREGPTLLELDGVACEAPAEDAGGKSECPEPFAAPWRLELIDGSDEGHGGIYTREALTSGGRPSYKAPHGNRVAWNASSSVWQLFAGDEGAAPVAILKEAAATPDRAKSHWQDGTGNNINTLLFKVAPPQRVRVVGDGFGAGDYCLQRERESLRPVYQREAHEEEENAEANENDVAAGIDGTGVTRLAFAPVEKKGHWELRKGDLVCRRFQGTKLQPHELPDGGVEALDTRARDPIRVTHDPSVSLVRDIVDDFDEKQADQPAEGGIDNIQNARAITSVVRWWHVSRFNWAVKVREDAFSQLRDVGDSDVEVDAPELTDTHCDFCGRQKTLHCMRAYRKNEPCPTSCDRCRDMGILTAPSAAEAKKRTMMHEVFWACGKCVKYLLGTPAARLQKKQRNATTKSPKKRGLKREMSGVAADSDAVRALFRDRPLEGLTNEELEDLFTSLGGSMDQLRWRGRGMGPRWRRKEIIRRIHELRGSSSSSSSGPSGASSNSGTGAAPTSAPQSSSRSSSNDGAPAKAAAEPGAPPPNQDAGAQGGSSSDDKAVEEEVEAVKFPQWHDPLFGKKIKRIVNGVVHFGKVEKVERGIVSRQLLYLVHYDDGDMEHLTGNQVRKMLVENPPPTRPPTRPPSPVFSDGSDEDEEEDPDAPMCDCNARARRHEVQRGTNVGRFYYRCSLWPDNAEDQCDFFQWAAEANAPKCNCNQPAITLSVRKQGPNCGRPFYVCPKVQPEKCKFFAWADATGVPCKCGEPTVRLQTKKPGPNKDRWFRKCNLGRCKFFEWDDQQSSSASSSQRSTHTTQAGPTAAAARPTAQAAAPSARASAVATPVTTAQAEPAAIPVPPPSRTLAMTGAGEPAAVQAAASEAAPAASRGTVPAAAYPKASSFAPAAAKEAVPAAATTDAPAATPATTPATAIETASGSPAAPTEARSAGLAAAPAAARPAGPAAAPSATPFANSTDLQGAPVASPADAPAVASMSSAAAAPDAAPIATQTSPDARGAAAMQAATEAPAAAKAAHPAAPLGEQGGGKAARAVPGFATSANVNGVAQVNCRCGTPSVRLQVRKEGPNTGRWFRKCNAGGCRFFEWEDGQSQSRSVGTVPSAQGSGSSPGDDKSRSGTCFKCGEAGHWASACPQKGRQRPSFGGDAAPRGGKCYRCNELGHWANACPRRP